MTMERSITTFPFALLVSLASALVLVVEAQQIPGFISIDCGATLAYKDERTQITYEPDGGFIDSGEIKETSRALAYPSDLQLWENVRSFPNGKRNCYSLRPDRGKNNTYLIRASFWYGNYDGKNEAPSFKIYIDVNYWFTVPSLNNSEEIMYVSQADDIQVCLVNIGKGVPFISALELRTLDGDIYRSGDGFLQLNRRRDVGLQLGSEIRHPFDVYDRIWTTFNYKWSILNTTSAIDLSRDNDAYKYKVPWEVLRTAESTPSSVEVPGPTLNSIEKWIVYLHLVEIEILTSGLRRFTISMNGNQFTKNVSLEYLKPMVVVSTPVYGSHIAISIDATNTSGNPPILNAIEFYTVGDLPNVPTAQDDVKAINDIKATYGIKRGSWQGDPCMPSDCTWDGLNCSYGNPPRIISLELSSSNLVGNIVSSLSHLSSLEYLDLSNNQLTGAIPESLAELPNLRFLNLSGNNLINSVPEALKKRVVDNTLNMSLTGNANLCLADPCPQKKKQKTMLVPVVTSVSGFFVVLFGALAIIWLVKRKRAADFNTITTTTNSTRGSCETLRLSKNRPFTYAEVTIITDNFRTVIGEGGFGKVYFGKLEDGTQIAVKMLSQSSKQGYKEFHAEAQLLMVVHHRNLVSLIGYCEEIETMALIYEFMSNGNVRQHLSGPSNISFYIFHVWNTPSFLYFRAARNLNVLSWSQRLQIAIDAAHGLEYLHDGCKPPTVHRDFKTANILLNENMQAKIADFGLSKTFATEHDSHITTHPAGTLGYLDPEFHTFGNLNKKSDVYSFGIVLFELITGHPAIIRSPEGSMHILHWVTPLIERGDIHSIVDPRLNGQFNICSAWKAVEIAMSCVPTTAVQRPDINRVLSELKECWTVEIGSGRSQRMGNSKRGSKSFEMTSIEHDIAPNAR